MSIIKTRPKSKRWTRSWSGRGLAMVNRMEESSEPTVQAGHVSIRQQLKELIAHSPDNPFYRSMFEAMRHRPLSSKQIRCIVTDYERHRTI